MSRAFLREQLPQARTTVAATQLFLAHARDLAAATHADHQEVLRRGALPEHAAPLAAFLEAVVFAAQFNAGAPLPLEPPVAGSPEAVWAAELAASTAGSLEAAVGTHVALQALQASPPETFAAGASMIAEELLAVISSMASAQQARIAWMASLVEAAG